MVKLNDLKEFFPNAKSTGNSNVIESLLPKYCKVFHIDSHDIEGGYRFQGVVIDGDPELDNPSVFDEMPLEVLKAAKQYRIIKNDGFIVWTVWF